MSFNLGTFPISANNNTLFEAPSKGIQAVLIGNESGLTVVITMENGGVAKTLYPGTVDWFQVNEGFTGNVKIAPIALLSNVATYPSSFLGFDAIGIRDPEQASMYPLALPSRNTNVGNVINTVGGTASAVQNDANIAGTSVIEATVSGDSGSAASLTNNGHLILGTLNNNGTFQLIGSLGDVTIDSTGKLTVDNRILANLLIAETGNDLTLGVAAAHKLAFQVNNADVVDINASGLSILSGKINLLSGAFSRVSTFTGTIGSAGALFNHGLGATPDIVLIQETNTAGDLNTFTYDPASLTTTQVKIFGAGATPRNFAAIAFKL